MKAAIVLISLIYSASAAPAVVWKNGDISAGAIHSSEDISAEDMLSDAFGVESAGSALDAAVFLLQREEDGSERLSSLASEGKLPHVAAEYNNCTAMHHHVSGIESPFTMVRDAKRASNQPKVMQIFLGEFSSKLTSLNKPDEVEVSDNGFVSKTEKHATKRTRSINEATIVVVSIDDSVDPEEIDSAVVEAINHESVGTVVLAGVRSVDEVKLERLMAARRRLEVMEKAGKKKALSPKSRRLEDQDNENEEEEENQDADQMSDIYYVYMTPNIFSGLLFTLLFAFASCVGLCCMGEISGQEVYVSKYPSIGREA